MINDCEGHAFFNDIKHEPQKISFFNNKYITAFHEIVIKFIGIVCDMMIFLS